jgi:hypothetical protein
MLMEPLFTLCLLLTQLFYLVLSFIYFPSHHTLSGMTTNLAATSLATMAYKLIHKLVKFFIAHSPGIYCIRHYVGKIIAIKMLSMGLCIPLKLKI